MLRIICRPCLKYRDRFLNLRAESLATLGKQLQSSYSRYSIASEHTRFVTTKPSVRSTRIMDSSAGPILATHGDEAKSNFSPRTPEQTSFSNVPDGVWQPMLESPCTFEPEMFLRVMHNLIKNPNIMSSHLFRADILYDSQKDHSIINEPDTTHFSDFTKHMKKDCQPIQVSVPGYQWQQTYVRQLVPRNRQLDKDLVQTCHFFMKKSGNSVSNLILYIPHVSDTAEMPWYHPKVKQVAFLHETTTDSGPNVATTGSVSVHFCLFPDYPLDERLERTALQLLSKIHKHSKGEQAGYVKRVHHDQIVPQQRFQDTYARLKATYAKKIIENWVEDTDPTKHVFEDLGIAAFLIELWADMYDCSDPSSASALNSLTPNLAKPKFPGFVDIGCGNGLLINLLNQEGYFGWGFDVRRRKTWQTFSSHIRDGIKEMVLVPKVLETEQNDEPCSVVDGSTHEDPTFHSGIFEKPDGSEPPFIISNHADELTPWTPLIAYLNGSPFIAIPCCSHNLAGARFRATAVKQAQKSAGIEQESAKLQSQDPLGHDLSGKQAAETGSLKKSAAAKKMPSAYASLCDYVSRLANEVGFKVEKEMLRIPSTRNACLLGRFPTRVNDMGSTGSLRTMGEQPDDNALKETSTLRSGSVPCSTRTKEEHVRDIITKELGMPVEVVRDDWIARARQIAGQKGNGH